MNTGKKYISLLLKKKQDICEPMLTSGVCSPCFDRIIQILNAYTEFAKLTFI